MKQISAVLGTSHELKLFKIKKCRTLRNMKVLTSPEVGSMKVFIAEETLSQLSQPFKDKYL